MAIVIVVEDGSIVANANSYVSVSDSRLFAESRGVVLPVDDDAIAAMLIQATDYLQSKECEYQGSRTSREQELSWPRIDVEINGNEFPSDKIPKNVIYAQNYLVMALNDGIPIMGNIVPGDFVIEETVGPITTKYSDPAKVGIGNMAPTLTAVDAALAPLFGSCDSQQFTLRTIRV